MAEQAGSRLYVFSKHYCTFVNSATFHRYKHALCMLVVMVGNMIAQHVPKSMKRNVNFIAADPRAGGGGAYQSNLLSGHSLAGFAPLCHAAKGLEKWCYQRS
jgi:hypothetical protein